MQVFVPYPDAKKSVECLDPSRLGNQIYRECLTLIRGGWPNHPVSKMWWLHMYFLCDYALAGLHELAYRGKHYPHIFDSIHKEQIEHENTGPPPWWGDERVHSSHRANLLRKDPEHYGQFGWEEQPAEKYYYPPFNANERVAYLQEYRKKNR